jgi:MFS family permease
VDRILSYISQQTGGFSIPMNFRARLPVIVFLSIVFFFNFSSRFIWGPMLGEIEHELEITHTTSGLLFLFITVGYFWGMLFSGYVSKHLSHGRTLSLSCIASGIILIAISVTHHLMWFKLLFVLLGVFSGFHLPSAIACVIDKLDSKDFSKALAIHELGPNLGFIICPLIVQVLLYVGSWRYTLPFLGISSIALGICYGFGERICNGYGELPTIKNIGFLFAIPIFWVMFILFALALSAGVGIYTMLPLYLQIERGMSSSAANYAVSVSRFSSIIAPLFASWLCVRHDNRRVTAFLIACAGLSTFLIPLSPNNLIWLPLVVQPFMIGAFFVPGYAMLADAVPTEFRNLSIALITPLAMLIGGGVTPMVIGIFADSHKFNTAFMLFGCLVSASASILFLGKMLRLSETKTKQYGQ